MAGRLVDYKAGDIILKEGEKNDKMYMISEGSVILYLNYGTENEYILGARGAGKIFGEMSMLAQDSCIYTAVAFTDVKAAWFQKHNIDQFLFGYPQSALHLLESIAKNNTLMRTSISMLMEELVELKGQALDHDEINKEVVKLSTMGISKNEPDKEQ